MDLLERAIWLSIGGVVGFVLGYIVRSLHEIKETVTEVDNIVKGQDSDARSKTEDGLLRRPLLLDFVLLIVVAFTVWASFQTAYVNNRLNNTIACITEQNVEYAKALSARDVAVSSGVQSEIDLWTTYERLYKIAKSNPKKIPVLQERLSKAIAKHKGRLEVTQERRHEYPYPRPNILLSCDESDHS